MCLRILVSVFLSVCLCLCLPLVRSVNLGKIKRHVCDQASAVFSVPRRPSVRPTVSVYCSGMPSDPSHATSGPAKIFRDRYMERVARCGYAAMTSFTMAVTSFLNTRLSVCLSHWALARIYTKPLAY